MVSKSYWLRELQRVRELWSSVPDISAVELEGYRDGMADGEPGVDEELIKAFDPATYMRDPALLFFATPAVMARNAGAAAYDMVKFLANEPADEWFIAHFCDLPFLYTPPIPESSSVKEPDIPASRLLAVDSENAFSLLTLEQKCLIRKLLVQIISSRASGDWSIAESARRGFELYWSQIECP